MYKDWRERRKVPPGTKPESPLTTVWRRPIGLHHLGTEMILRHSCVRSKRPTFSTAALLTFDSMEGYEISALFVIVLAFSLDPARDLPLFQLPESLAALLSVDIFKLCISTFPETLLAVGCRIDQMIARRSTAELAALSDEFGTPVSTTSTQATSEGNVVAVDMAHVPSTNSFYPRPTTRSGLAAKSTLATAGWPWQLGVILYPFISNAPAVTAIASTAIDFIDAAIAAIAASKL
ncbi:hypothetical protein C8R45DRAFT_935924 [Mycena sanguinolenta]|nr:hypothetical protein C8R45DRAFT_935924 [Mycena sanguinolenta]